MKPIEFSCETRMASGAEDIGALILEPANWEDFSGYGPIPGIASAEFELRTEAVEGSRIRVLNLDGSTHVEEIREWDPGKRIVMRMGDFSAPLSRLARAFDEVWEFDESDGGTRVVRMFRLHAKSVVTWPVLWLVSLLLRRAIARHMEVMRASEAG